MANSYNLRDVERIQYFDEHVCTVMQCPCILDIGPATAVQRHIDGDRCPVSQRSNLVIPQMMIEVDAVQKDYWQAAGRDMIHIGSNSTNIGIYNMRGYVIHSVLLSLHHLVSDRKAQFSRRSDTREQSHDSVC